MEFLVGFTNKGSQEFILESLEASFRYPMDFSFYIQNFSNIAYNRIVKPNHEATLAYSFIPAEAFAGRPFGLNINLNYRDLVSVCTDLNVTYVTLKVSNRVRIGLGHNV